MAAGRAGQRAQRGQADARPPDGAGGDGVAAESQDHDLVKPGDREETEGEAGADGKTDGLTEDPDAELAGKDDGDGVRGIASGRGEADLDFG